MQEQCLTVWEDQKGIEKTKERRKRKTETKGNLTEIKWRLDQAKDLGEEAQRNNRNTNCWYNIGKI